MNPSVLTRPEKPVSYCVTGTVYHDTEDFYEKDDYCETFDTLEDTLKYVEKYNGLVDQDTGRSWDLRSVTQFTREPAGWICTDLSPEVLPRQYVSSENAW